MSVEEKLSEYVFTWKIENYSCCYQEKGQYIESPIFCIDIVCGTQWVLWFYPKGDNRVKQNENFVSCFLVWKTSGGLNKTPAIDYRLEIVDEKNNVLKSLKGDKSEFTLNEPGFGLPKFLANDELTKFMDNFKEDVLTLRCGIKCDKQTLSGSEACTTIGVNRICADWDVKIPLYLDYSESISFEISKGYKFELTFTSSLEFATILIHLKESTARLPQQVTFRIIFYGKGNKMIFKRAGHLFETTEKWKFPNFITREMLEDCKTNSTYFDFKLKCEVNVAKKLKTSSIDSYQFKNKACFDSADEGASVSSMHIDFRSLFMSRKHSDATIRVESEDFPVHKLVLRVRSPVFDAMFDQNMQENQTGIVDVADVDRKTTKAFLQYLYTETVDAFDYEIAKKLLIAADKYEVTTLVSKCVSHLKSVLSFENVCEIIEIADLINNENLKSFGINFIKANLDEILRRPQWKEFINNNQTLAANILSELFVKSGKC